MEYTVLTCRYKMIQTENGPGEGPFAKQVMELLASGWRFRGKLYKNTMVINRDPYVFLIQEFTRGEIQE